MKEKKLLCPLALILAAVVLLSGCGLTGQEPAAVEPTPHGGTDVIVNALAINLMESFPVQVSVTVRGDLVDGCVALEGITPTAVEGGWVLDIASSRAEDMVCSEALVPFEETVPLEVVGLPAGSYRVTAGEQTASFTLEMDNALPETAAPEPVITLERTPCFGFCPVYADKYPSFCCFPDMVWVQITNINI